MKSLHDREIVGASAIARRLGCSSRTVLRYYGSGRLPAQKLGGPTSPLRISLKEIEAFKAGKGEAS